MPSINCTLSGRDLIVLELPQTLSQRPGGALALSPGWNPGNPPRKSIGLCDRRLDDKCGNWDKSRPVSSISLFTTAKLVGGNLYVAFAQQNQAKNFVNFGAKLGAVDVFSPAGVFLQRLEVGSWFNAPWGLVLAPTDFGIFSHSVLVGQFGSGEILAFDAVTGRFQGQLLNQDNNAISTPGLWGIAFGAGNTNSGGANQLFFNAGINQGKGGLFGNIAPVASDLTQGNDQ
jgi:hypothetical protein